MSDGAWVPRLLLLFAPLLPGASQTQPGRAVECLLPLAQAQALAESRPLIRRVDQSDGDVDSILFQRDPAGVSAFGVPLGLLEILDYEDEEGIEHEFSGSGPGEYSSVRTAMLAAHGRSECAETRHAGRASCTLDLAPVEDFARTLSISETGTGIWVRCRYHRS